VKDGGIESIEDLNDRDLFFNQDVNGSHEKYPYKKSFKEFQKIIIPSYTGNKLIQEFEDDDNSLGTGSNSKLDSLSKYELGTQYNVIL
jgi:hypothetical protein